MKELVFIITYIVVAVISFIFVSDLGYLRDWKSWVTYVLLCTLFNIAMLNMVLPVDNIKTGQKDESISQKMSEVEGKTTTTDLDRYIKIGDRVPIRLLEVNEANHIGYKDEIIVASYEKVDRVHFSSKNALYDIENIKLGERVKVKNKDGIELDYIVKEALMIHKNKDINGEKEMLAYVNSLNGKIISIEGSHTSSRYVILIAEKYGG